MYESIFTLSELKENYATLLKLLTQVQEEQLHVKEAFAYLKQIPCGNFPGDIAGQAKAIAAGDIVKSRESTNQQLLDVYSKMYEDLRNVIFKQTDASANQ